MARIRELIGTFFDTFVRENRVLPPVAALLALLLFAWVLAGALVNGEGEEPPGGQADLVQSRDPAPAPEVEDRDADSYAAYRNKDPFRQLLAPAESTTEDTTGGTTTAEETPPGDTTASVPPADDSGSGNRATRRDSDGDGIPNRREERLGLDPRNPDTDGDGIDDDQDDADGDGAPDGKPTGSGGGTGSGGNGGGGNGGTRDELFDSGGYAP